MRNPKFKECFVLEKIGEEGIVVLSENNYSWITGRPFVIVSPYLDGKHSIDQILTILENKISMPEIFYAIESLKSEGYLVETQNEMPPKIESFWNSLNVDIAKNAKNKTNKTIGIKVFGEVEIPKNLEGFFKNSDLNLATEDDTPDFYLALTDDYDRKGLSDWNKQMLENKTPWLLCKMFGMNTWLGPLMNSDDETACWECTAQRIRANRQMESYIQVVKEKNDAIITSRSAFAPSVNIVLNMAVMEIAKFFMTNENKNLKNILLTINNQSLEIERHFLVKRPQCKACGSAEYYKKDREATLITLKSSPKSHKNDGGHRVMSAEATYQKYKHHISPLTGVITSLDRLDRYESDLIYTYGAGHNFAMMTHRGMYFMLKNLRGRSGGKGITEIQAKVSGMCEAIERYSGVYRGDEVAFLAAYHDIAHQALHPNSYLLFSESQYEKRHEQNKDEKSDYHKVPEPFDENRIIEWSPLTCLNDNTITYVPAAYCYFGHPDILTRFDTACDANGNAAGNTIEEAIFQGFLELVERDAVAVWWYNRIKRQEIDIDSFEIPYLTDLQKYFASTNRNLWVLDISSDLGIHTYVALSQRTDNPVEDIVLGFGAHLDPKIALLRAVTEVNQFMPCVSNTKNDGETDYWFDDPAAIDWWKTATLANQPYLVPDANLPKLRFEEIEDKSTHDLKIDIEICVKAAEELGMKTYVLDQTRPDIGLNIAKVIVPGLRHFWKRFDKGRLYDVAVKMGYRETPIDEKDLNPIGIFF
jgi:oxazoline/thiazoline synthase